MAIRQVVVNPVAEAGLHGDKAIDRRLALLRRELAILLTRARSPFDGLLDRCRPGPSKALGDNLGRLLPRIARSLGRTDDEKHRDSKAVHQALNDRISVRRVIRPACPIDPALAPYPRFCPSHVQVPSSDSCILIIL